MYLVMYRWTGDRLAAITSGALFAFTAHNFSRIPHLQALHLEFLPLAIAALDDLFVAPGWRAALWFAAWFTLQGLTSNYQLVFLTLAVAAVAIARLPEWRGRNGLRVARSVALAAGAAGIVLALFRLRIPRARHGSAGRLLGYVAQFSGSSGSTTSARPRACTRFGAISSGPPAPTRRSFPASSRCCWRSWRSSPAWPYATGARAPGSPSASSAS